MEGSVDAEAEGAFREFVTARTSALLRAAYLLTGDAGDAEDAVQQALTRVYLAWPRIRHREAVDAYARRTLVREVASWRRRRRIRFVLAASVPERPAAAEATSSDERDALRPALLGLSPRQRAVVVLRFYEDMSEREVAETLGISTGAVKQHTSRALDRLRRALAESATAGQEVNG
jgi:RNA polymerase sigma-70 factor, ECF subfamily